MGLSFTASALLRDGLIEILLHGGQARRGVKDDLGITLAWQQILSRRWQHGILILPLDKFERPLALRDVPDLSPMEADFVGSIQVDRQTEVRAQLRIMQSENSFHDEQWLGRNMFAPLAHAQVL